MKAMALQSCTAATSKLKRKRKEGKSERKMKHGKSEKKRKDADVPKSHIMLKGDHDDEEVSPRSKVVESQHPDDNDSELTEGFDAEENVEFSHSDEEDVRINGQSTSDDSVQLSWKELLELLQLKGW